MEKEESGDLEREREGEQLEEEGVAEAEAQR